jgi:hypothetical protein
VGYFSDPQEYEAETYESILVPRILGLPPFKPETAQALVNQANQLLKKLTA